MHSLVTPGWVGSPERLKEFLAHLSEDPGVYLMKGSLGEILYVGKAKNLKNRVSSYFQDSRHHTDRIRALVQRIATIDVFLTDNEVEALVLECNLIKKHRPRFNVMFKDDKSYPYVRIDDKKDFPRVEMTRRLRKDGARYFGPYVNSTKLRETLEWARKTLGLRDCSDHEFRNRVRPCVLHQIGQCSAPCVGLISVDEYRQRLQLINKILEGKTDDLRRDCAEKMREASEKEEYERAQFYLSLTQGLEALQMEQKILDPESNLDRDVVAFCRGLEDYGDRAAVVILEVREGKADGVFQYPVSQLDPQQNDGEVLFEFLSQFYLQKGAGRIPKEVLLPEGAKKMGPTSLEGPPQDSVGLEEEFHQRFRLLSNALGVRVDFRVPQRGEAVHLLEMVNKTAEHYLQEVLQNRKKQEDDLKDVQERLNLKRLPHRLECYDISHFQGEGTVASRVVFIDGKPEPALYRHYHVATVSGPDDFKSMYEVLSRRFSKKEELPDLVVIDGGKGQLGQIEKVFEELGLEGVELVSLAKARTVSDFQSPDIEETQERVFKCGQKNPIALRSHTGAYRILTQARNESHRFAITFHRKVRDRKRVVTGVWPLIVLWCLSGFLGYSARAEMGFFFAPDHGYSAMAVEQAKREIESWDRPEIRGVLSVHKQGWSLWAFHRGLDQDLTLESRQEGFLKSFCRLEAGVMVARDVLNSWEKVRGYSALFRAVDELHLRHAGQKRYLKRLPTRWQYWWLLWDPKERLRRLQQDYFMTRGLLRSEGLLWGSMPRD